MKRYSVYSESFEFRNIREDDINFYNENVDIFYNDFNAKNETNSGDIVDYKTVKEFEDLTTAHAYYNGLKANTYSLYVWGNNLLKASRVVLECSDIDEDGDILDSEYINIEMLPII